MSQNIIPLIANGSLIPLSRESVFRMTGKWDPKGMLELERPKADHVAYMAAKVWRFTYIRFPGDPRRYRLQRGVEPEVLKPQKIRHRDGFLRWHHTYKAPTLDDIWKAINKTRLELAEETILNAAPWWMLTEDDKPDPEPRCIKQDWIEEISFYGGPFLQTLPCPAPSSGHSS